MCSFYTDRWIKFAQEGTWGTWATPTTFPNYLLEWSATTTENKNEDDLIGGSRDWRKRVWLEEGIVGRWRQELVSAKIFEYILGAKSGTTSPATYSPTSTLPCMSIYRGLYPDESGNTVSIGYAGMKVDTSELTVEEGEDIRLELNFAGKNATIPSASAKGILDMSVIELGFGDSSIDVVTDTGTTLSGTLIQRLVISTNNNLNARYSSGVGSYKATELREGGFEVSGRLVMGGQFNTISSQVLNRTSNTIITYLKKTGSTITITLSNVSFGELADELSGLEPVSIELPFTARPVSGNDAMKVVESFTGTYVGLPY